MTTCLITGANRGIGLELARLYAASGANVIATARDPGKAAALRELAASSGKVEVLPLDVSDEASLAAFSKALSGRGIDLLVVNSGVSGPRGPMSDAGNTHDAWARIFATNVAGAFMTVKACDTSLANGSKVAIISSIMASAGNANGASYPYRASKAAVANVGANLAVELKPRGVAVGIYHPGWVRTDMGGPSAAIDVGTSAGGLKQRFAALTLATTGVFEDYAGKPITF